MPVQVQCGNCGGKFRAPDEALGKRVKCPKCSGVIEVPRVPSSDSVGQSTGTKDASGRRPQSRASPSSAISADWANRRRIELLNCFYRAEANPVSKNPFAPKPEYGNLVYSERGGFMEQKRDIYENAVVDEKGVLFYDEIASVWIESFGYKGIQYSKGGFGLVDTGTLQRFLISSWPI